MRVLIAGAGRGGLSLAAHLQGIGHIVTVLDREPQVVRRAVEDHGVVALECDATDGVRMHEAEAGRADVVLALLHRDADNLAVAMLARDLGARRVMVRMRDLAYRALYESAGVERILSETEIFIGALATAIEHEAVRHSMVLGAGESVAFEVAIPANARVAGRTVSEIAEDPQFPRSCVFAGLSDEHGMRAPRGATVLAAGTRALLVAPRAELGSLLAFLLRQKAI
jgi:trk system potassium uptake protein